MHIIRYPHPTLRRKSKPLRRVDAELKKIIREMFEMMYEGRGIGLAANQVDLPYRLVVINLEADKANPEAEMVFINPVITERKGMAEDQEGCLSFPEIFAPVRRPEKVVLSAFNLKGEEVSYEMNGLCARAVQHELDHLDGVLFIDRLSPSSRLSIREDLEALELAFEGDRQRGLIPDDEAIAARLQELEEARSYLPAPSARV